jgi:excinuclease ABC subunit B
VLVLDADQEGFLRSTTSLIQTIGRAARNVEGRVVLYADRETNSIRQTIEESERRRTIQIAYNEEHGIIPQTIRKKIAESLSDILAGEHAKQSGEPAEVLGREALEQRRHTTERSMLKAASELDFESAVKLRDEMHRIESLLLQVEA